MILKNKYVFGCLIQFYELEMLDEHIKSCVQMLEGIENPENVTFDFCFSVQEHYEKINWEYFEKKWGYNHFGKSYSISFKIGELKELFEHKVGIDGFHPAKHVYHFKTSDDSFYNIADYRRELNDKYCMRTDYICWSECDSLWPKQTLRIIEGISEHSTQPKHIITFAYRKNWDKSWDILTHPMFKNVPYNENDVLTGEWSEKSYMSLERMNEINDVEDVEIKFIHKPKFDGSCLVISSELIKSGINIPRSLILAGEDTSFALMCEKVLSDKYAQYHVSNILRVHNRRHPNKRTGILNENNPNGFCDERKGDWWEELEKKSKFNLNHLFEQVKFEKL